MENNETKIIPIANVAVMRETDDINDINDTTRSSCDPITNKTQDGGSKCLINFSPYDIDNIYDNYQKFLAKNEDIIFQLDNFDKIKNNVLNAYKTQIKLYENSQDPAIIEHKNKVNNY